MDRRNDRPFLSGVILAAGASERMGRPKQLLDIGGRTLLQYAIDAALRADRLDEVVLVLGAAAEQIRGAIALPRDREIRVAVNADHGKGQSTSLLAGLAAASAKATAAAVLLGDQPGVSPRAIDAVVDGFAAGGRPVARALYRAATGERVPGHPVILGREVWSELQRLQGDEGARAVLVRHPEWILEVPVDEEPPVDIDTAEDYRRALTARGGWR